MKLPILCMQCQVHIMNLETSLLAWPLHFEMFEYTSPNWKLPSGKMHTDFFCPICFGFPLHWDAGTGEVGKWLNVMGGDGKPKMVSVEQLLKGRPIVWPINYPTFEPTRDIGKFIADGMNKAITESKNCHQCGAKPGRGGKILMHKKGCPTRVPVQDLAPVPLPVPVETHKGIIEQVTEDFIKDVEKRVSKGDEGEGPVTKAEIAELEHDRMTRGRPATTLRAIQD